MYSTSEILARGAVSVSTVLMHSSSPAVKGSDANPKVAAPTDKKNS